MPLGGSPTSRHPNAGRAFVSIQTIDAIEPIAGADHSLDTWLEAARGTDASTRQCKEGVVVRPLVEQTSAPLDGRLSFKVIHNDFLLKDED